MRVDFETTIPITDIRPRTSDFRERGALVAARREMPAKELIYRNDY
jgi:hypothetical protein